MSTIVKNLFDAVGMSFVASFIFGWLISPFVFSYCILVNPSVNPFKVLDAILWGMNILLIIPIYLMERGND